MHFEMGNVKLAEDDFEAVENLFNLDGDHDTVDAFRRIRRLWKRIPRLYSRDLHALSVMHRERAEMYEDLGCPEKAELDRQKAKELRD